MKSTTFFARFALILLIKNINGQNNAFTYNENWEVNGPETMQQPLPTYAIVKTIQDLMNQNQNTAELADTQRIRLPPDLQQQSLQVQQCLQLKKPLQLQQNPPLQQPLQVHPPTQVQPLTQSKLSFDTLQSLTPLQTQDIVQLQSLQKQPQLRSDIQWQSYQPQQPLQSLELQQLHQSQTVQTPPPLQQTLQSHVPSPPVNTMQQLLELPQLNPKLSLPSFERKNDAYTQDMQYNQIQSNNHPISQINMKLQSSSPLGAVNFENLYNTRNPNIQSRPTPTNSPIDVMATAYKFKDKPQETLSLTNSILCQPPISSSAVSTAPVLSNCQAPTKPRIKPIEITNTASYNYVIPSAPNQFTNTQLQYNNPASEPSKIPNINLNSGFRFPEQPPMPVVQRQLKSFVPSQTSIASATPFFIPQAPTEPSQYAISSGYPTGTVLASSNTRNKSVSNSLKSILPIIFQLLKEKVATCGCSNDCPCECKNDKSDNKLDVTCGYASKKEYGCFAKDILPVLDTVPEEEQGPVCLREPKNCEEPKNASLEANENISEEDECSDEEELDEDEEN